MSNLVDKKIGEVGEFKVDQTAGTLSVEADVVMPISVNGVSLGNATGKMQVQIEELAILELLAAKYPVLQSAIDFVKKELQPAQPAA